MFLKCEYYISVSHPSIKQGSLMDSTQTTKATRLGVNLDKSKYVIMS